MMEMPNQSQICCFTGHRNIQPQDAGTLKLRLEEAICALVHAGVTHFVCGGARGFDMLAGTTVLELKRTHLGLRLILVLPCRNQDNHWPPAERAMYCDLLAAADQVTCLSDEYAEGCMKMRNQYMVDISGSCIAYLRQHRTGTGQTVRMAHKRGTTVFLL